MLAGTMTRGASRSTTVTVNDPVATLPAASVAVQVTVVVPIGKVEPEAGTQTTFTARLLSVPVTTKVTTALLEPGAAGTMRLGGSSSTGRSRSMTVTSKLVVAVLPEASVAVQVTVVVPMGKREPEAGVQRTLTAEQLSVAVGTKVTTAESRPASAFTEMLPGPRMTGSWRSWTVTVKELVALFWEASMATQITVLVPTGNTDPEGGVQTMTVPGALSRTTGLKVNTAEHCARSATTTMFGEGTSTGGSRSMMVTVKLQVAVLPAASRARQTTVVMPIGKLDPDGGVQVRARPGMLSAAGMV